MQKNLWVDYTKNVYEVMDRLRAKHPGLEIESCAGGGGRVDMGILERIDQFWTSDNTDAIDRILIQEGFSYAYAPKFMMGRVPPVVSKSGYSNTRAGAPLEFRFLVGMMGSLGISLNLNALSEEDTATVRRMVGLYKEIRDTTQRGDLYRIKSLRTGDLAVSQFVAQDGKQSAVFVLQKTRQFYPVMSEPVYLRGLDPLATYEVRALHPQKLMETITTASGSWLMGAGLHFKFEETDMDGTLLILRRL
jgi:alpha-galactosidase